MTDWPQIIDELIAAGMSKAQIARHLHTGRSRVQRWHYGTGRPKEPIATELLGLHRRFANRTIRTYETDLISRTLLSTPK